MKYVIKGQANSCVATACTGYTIPHKASWVKGILTFQTDDKYLAELVANKVAYWQVNAFPKKQLAGK